MSIVADNRIAELEAWRARLEAEIATLRSMIDELLEDLTQRQEVRHGKPR